MQCRQQLVTPEQWNYLFPASASLEYERLQIRCLNLQKPPYSVKHVPSICLARSSPAGRNGKTTGMLTPYGTIPKVCMYGRYVLSQTSNIPFTNTQYPIGLAQESGMDESPVTIQVEVRLDPPRVSLDEFFHIHSHDQPKIHSSCLAHS